MLENHGFSLLHTLYLGYASSAATYLSIYSPASFPPFQSFLSGWLCLVVSRSSWEQSKARQPCNKLIQSKQNLKATPWKYRNKLENPYKSKVWSSKICFFKSPSPFPTPHPSPSSQPPSPSSPLQCIVPASSLIWCNTVVVVAVWWCKDIYLIRLIYWRGLPVPVLNQAQWV